MDYWEHLLERFLKNECTERENKLIFQALKDGWIDDAFRNAIESFLLSDESFEQERVPEEILQNIQKETHGIASKQKKQIKRFQIPAWLKVAVVILLAIPATWYVFHSLEGEGMDYGYNTITVPAGQTVQLTLADGTDIWLNARSKLKYPGVFDKNSRDVFLDGEGYFSVSPNLDKPFVVHTTQYNIQVLGTEFNVDAYSKSDDFSTSLLKGSVRLMSVKDSTQSLTLEPNMIAHLSSGILVTDSIADFNHYRWREGLISFKNVSFTDLMVKFEKCYGIKIVVENREVFQYMCTGMFRKADGVDYALRVLQRDVKFEFGRDEISDVIYIR